MNRFYIEWNHDLENDPWKRQDSVHEVSQDYWKPPSLCSKATEKNVQIDAFVDAIHAGNLVTRRSQTGILIYYNMAPIKC